LFPDVYCIGQYIILSGRDGPAPASQVRGSLQAAKQAAYRYAVNWLFARIF